MNENIPAYIGKVFSLLIRLTDTFSYVFMSLFTNFFHEYRNMGSGGSWLRRRGTPVYPAINELIVDLLHRIIFY